MSAIKSITTPTATEVVINLSHTTGVLLPALETSGATYVTDPTALAKEGEKEYALSPVGAGPFRLVNNLVSSSLTLASWSGYWDAKAIHLKTITVLSGSNSATELDSMQSGTAQLLYFPADATEEEGALADSSSLQTLTTNDDVFTTFLTFNPGTSPFKSKLAREAIFYATDRAVFAKAIFRGLVAPTEQMIGTSMQDFSGNNLPGELGYDPAKAKALVKDLGGLKVTLQPLSNNTIDVLEVEALAKEWAAVGIKTTLQVENITATLGQMQSGDFEVVLGGYPNQANGALGLETTLTCKAFLDPDYCDPTVANDEAKALDAVNLTEQTQLMRSAMIQAITKDYAFLPLLQGGYVVVAKKDLRGFQVYGGILYVGKAYYG
jgi:peptide/nickel transport system substrate-binding protein